MVRRGTKTLWLFLVVAVLGVAIIGAAGQVTALGRHATEWGARNAEIVRRLDAIDVAVAHARTLRGTALVEGARLDSIPVAAALQAASLDSLHGLLVGDSLEELRYDSLVSLLQSQRAVLLEAPGRALVPPPRMVAGLSIAEGVDRQLSGLRAQAGLRLSGELRTIANHIAVLQWWLLVECLALAGLVALAFRVRQQAGRAEQAYLESLRAITTASGTMAVRLSPEGRYLFATDDAAAMLGTTPAALLGKTMREGGVPEEVLDLVEPALGRVFTTGERQVVALAMPVEGMVRHFMACHEPERDARGRIRSAAVGIVDVTAARLAEQGLAQERAFMAAALDQMSDGLIACNADGKVTIMNRLLRERCGVAADADLDQAIRRLGLCLPGGERVGEGTSPLFRALRGERIEGAPYEVEVPGHGRRQLRCSAAPILAADGTRLGAILTARDVTEAMRAEAEREARERTASMIEAIAEASNIHVLQLDRDRHIRFANAPLVAYFGRPLEELRHLTLAEAGTERSIVEAMHGPIETAFATGERQLAHFPFGGPERPQHRMVVLTPARDAAGGVESVLLVSSDITALRQAELGREAERQTLSAILDQMEEELVACDADGRMVLFNRAARHLSDNQDGRYVAAPWPAQFHFCEPSGEEMLAPGEMPLARALHGETVHNRELWLVRQGHPARIIVANARQLRRADGTVLGAVAVGRDVTAQRQLEADRQKAQRLEATGRMAAGIAHDFNSLFTAVQFCLELAEQEAARGGDPRSYLQDIGGIVTRAAQVTGQLVSYCRGLPMPGATLRLDPWLHGVEAPLRLALPSRIGLTVGGLDGQRGTTVGVDGAQLERVLRTLVQNAGEAIRGAGSVTLTRGRVELAEPLPHLTGTLPPGRYATLAVRDTGSGMPPEVVEHLFEPFFTTKPVGEGTGLGLSTVHGIVGQAGGAVLVETAPGAGSCFTVYLPEQEGGAPPVPAGPAAGAPPEVRTILLVDDDDDLRDTLARILLRAGYRVRVAASAEAANALVAEAPEPLDLLITDSRLPDRSGVELTRELADGGRWLPVVFITGYSEDEVPAAWLTQPGFRFLQKPFSMDEFLQAVEALLPPT